MSEIDDGAQPQGFDPSRYTPAFPKTVEVVGSGETVHYFGLSIRDYFAAKAMHALMHDQTYHLRPDREHVANRAYEYADAMMKERAK